MGRGKVGDGGGGIEKVGERRLVRGEVGEGREGV